MLVGIEQQVKSSRSGEATGEAVPDHLLQKHQRYISLRVLGDCDLKHVEYSRHPSVPLQDSIGWVKSSHFTRMPQLQANYVQANHGSSSASRVQPKVPQGTGPNFSVLEYNFPYHSLSPCRFAQRLQTKCITITARIVIQTLKRLTPLLLCCSSTRQSEERPDRTVKAAAEQRGDNLLYR